MSTLNIRIPDELNNTLISFAKELERPKGYIVRKALEDYFRELRLQMQEDEEDLRIALERMSDPNRKFYTSEQVDAMFEQRKKASNV